MNTKISSKVYEFAFRQEHERMEVFIQDIILDKKHGVPFLLNLFGPKGFGKSTFLEKIWHDYKEEEALATSFIRIGQYLNEGSDKVDITRLIKNIISQLRQNLSSMELTTEYENWFDNVQLANYLNKIFSYIRISNKVILLLIDDYDLIPEEQQYWLQENIISPASREKKFASIMTSQTPLRFNNSFELRMRLENRELKGLDVDTIKLVLPEDAQELANETYKITGGVPLLLVYLIDLLEKNEIRTMADFKVKSDDINKLYYRAVEERLLETLQPEERETILILALLSQFNVKKLKLLLPKLLQEIYKDYGTEDYLELIDRLRPWVEWQRQGGYSLNPTYKLMLKGYVSVSKPDLFLRVSQESPSEMLSTSL